MIYGNMLAEKVAEYNINIKPSADEEHYHYQNQESLDKAIDCAVYAVKANGKRHSHQYRIKLQTMEAVRKELTKRKSDLLACQNFEELHEIVRECAVMGFAALSIYDTALRLGAYLGIRPNHVYLHRGTTVGAAMLGLNVAGDYISKDKFPQELQNMQADDIENFYASTRAN